MRFSARKPSLVNTHILMHLLQGTLSAPATLMTSTAASFALGAAVYGLRRELSPKQVPALAAMTGFIFLAQMVNCATGFGFSGHLVGGALLAVLFGPCSAMLSMAVILTGQVALLGDGSLSTLGANFLSMGVVAPWVAFGVFRLLQGARQPQCDFGQLVAMALASFSSILAATYAVSWMIAAALPSLLLTASVWAALESILSLFAFALCVSVRRDAAVHVWQSSLKPIAVLCLFTLCCLPFSSDQADGLEHMLHMAIGG